MILLKFYKFLESLVMFFEFALIGPTASGKTAIANALAYEFKAVVLSLDSLCIYKQINIANAKSEDKVLKELDYFGVNLLNVDEHFNVSLFIQEYNKAKKWAQDKQKILIITGGTSFYLKILMQGLSEKIEEKEVLIDNNEIYKLLQKIDPDFKIEKNDTYRLRKWFNIYESTKEIPSLFLKRTKKKPLTETIEIYNLFWDKEELRKNIQKRTKFMLDSGLIDEAKNLFDQYDANLKPLNSIGLKECKAYLNNQISYQELENLINIHTAQLAKRQRTFNKQFKKIDLNYDEAFLYLQKKLQSLK